MDNKGANTLVPGMKNPKVPNLANRIPSMNFKYVYIAFPCPTDGIYVAYYLSLVGNHQVLKVNLELWNYS